MRDILKYMSHTSPKIIAIWMKSWVWYVLEVVFGQSGWGNTKKDKSDRYWISQKA
jgi:hypothetical protein